jgi:predicted DCC family thiol-disulfide oxidoreductase YuxK
MDLKDTSYIIYDGDCYFCSSYVQFTELKKSIGEVLLLNARDGGDIVLDVISKGYNLDEGMILVYKDEYYHGDACMHMIALLSKPTSIINRMIVFLSRSRILIKLMYPILRLGRNTINRLRGIPKIHQD